MNPRCHDPIVMCYQATLRTVEAPGGGRWPGTGRRETSPTSVRRDSNPGYSHPKGANYQAILRTVGGRATAPPPLPPLAHPPPPPLRPSRTHPPFFSFSPPPDPFPAAAPSVRRDSNPGFLLPKKANCQAILRTGLRALGELNPRQQRDRLRCYHYTKGPRSRRRRRAVAGGWGRSRGRKPALGRRVGGCCCGRGPGGGGWGGAAGRREKGLGLGELGWSGIPTRKAAASRHPPDWDSAPGSAGNPRAAASRSAPEALAPNPTHSALPPPSPRRPPPPKSRAGCSGDRTHDRAVKSRPLCR